MDREMETLLLLFVVVFLLSVTSTRGQEKSPSGGSGDGGGDSSVLSAPLIAVVALIAVFSAIIIALTIAIVIMCRHRSVSRVDFRSKASNTYRGFSQERTQSPPESTVIHDPLSRAPSSRSSHSCSHSHPPTSPSSLHPSTVAHTPLSSSTNHPVSESQGRHTYHHLRQHEGMQLPPPDYPEHEYSSLGPRSETPPLCPPKPVHLRTAHLSGSHSDSLSNEPPISATAPSWSAAENPPIVGSQSSNTVSQKSVLQSPKDCTNTGMELHGDEDDDVVFPRRSIYDTMEDTTHSTSVTGCVTKSEVTGNDHKYYVLEKPSKPDLGGDYDTLAMQTNQRKQQKSSVKIFDDPGYSAAKQRRSNSVKIMDPRYIGDYERHPDYVSPQIDIPKEQLEEKYRGDYERNPTYFLKHPLRSFSVSTSSGISQEQQHRSPSLNSDPRLNRYRGDYERSKDYIPSPLQNGNMRIGADYVLEPDPKYMGAYERHPDYVPPLVRRPSKSRVQILSKDSTGASSTVERPSNVPHEYTALADVTKDPPQQYATLNSDLATTRSLPSSPKDSTV